MGLWKQAAWVQIFPTLLTTQLWAIYSLCFSFVICKMEQIILLTHEVVRVKCAKTCEGLEQGLGHSQH